MRKIRIKFTDQWRDFDNTDNFFWNILSEKYELELSENPEILIYGPFGFKYRQYDCLKVFLTGENVRPNFWECDYAFSFDYPISEKNYRFPIYAFIDDPFKLTKKDSPEIIGKSKTKFCNFVYSNTKATERIEFFKLLSEYKKVDSGGGVLNNLGYRVQNKIDFLSEYKFTISFENSGYPGYTTEKIFQPMSVNSIPIYWGNPLVGKEFNPKSFVNVHEFGSFQEAVKYIIELDTNEELYHKMLKEPYFHNNQVPENLLRENVLRKFDQIIGGLGTCIPVSRTLKPRLSYLKKGLINRRKKWLKKFAQ